MGISKCLAVLLGLLPAVLPVSAADNVRIMSYNVRNAKGLDNVRDVDRTAAVINRINPDVVAVQELDSVTRRSDGTYVLGEIAARTGMYATYAPAIDYDGGKYGIGILSRKKPVAVYRRALPGREEARALVVAEFDNYKFCSTHLSLNEDDRLASIDVIKNLAGGDKPLFIAGDMNDYPDSRFIRSLAGSFTILNDTTKRTFPADKPDITIDYIAAYNQPDKMYVLKSRKILDEPVASDHRPLVVDVTVCEPLQLLMRTRPYLQNPAGNGMTVMWETSVPAYSWVEYGTDTLNLMMERVLIDGQADFTKTIHKIRLDNLSPATKYFYRVCSQEIPDYRAYHKEFGVPVKSEFHSFTTMDPNAGSFTAAVFNDLHQHEATFDLLRRNLAGINPDFVVFNGDCVDDPRNHAQATYFISRLCEGVGADSIPAVFLRGNHEIRNAYSVGLRDHYDYVGGKTYGAFNWGDTRIVMLDCGEDKVDSTWVYYGLNDFTQLRKDQVEFLKDELSGKPFRKADKRILIHHIPLYGNSEKNLCGELWRPLLEKAPFDVSLNAHVHKFGYHPKGAEGNTYPVIKGGGYKPESATVMILDKNKDRLNVRVLDVNGKELLNENF